MTEWVLVDEYSEISYPISICAFVVDLTIIRSWFPCEADANLLKQADGRPIVAISLRS